MTRMIRMEDKPGTTMVQTEKELFKIKITDSLNHSYSIASLTGSALPNSDAFILELVSGVENSEGDVIRESVESTATVILN